MYGNMYHNLKKVRKTYIHVQSLTEAMKPELLIRFDMNYTISIFMPAHRYGRMKYL